MKLPIKWLNEYTEMKLSSEAYQELMMRRGFETDAVEALMSDVTNVVVGRITKIEKHQDSDHLLICKVEAGGEPIQIVTGAPNVFEGAYVPVALHGAHLPSGVVIKRGKIRGAVSEGMLCSGEELKLKNMGIPGAEVNGILILQGEPQIGISVQQLFGLDETVFEFDILPNRPDCQCILGMARETAAATGNALRELDYKIIKGEGDIKTYASIDVLDSTLCPRYTARVMTDINIAPSPEWMQQRLRTAGVRPINNIVDITNYVMLEYGQPMHAFDLSCVKNGHIIVRRAHTGETTTTLDGKARELSETMLVIADEHGAVGIAGVMGGENSEITENTKTVLFESALFSATSIRTTSNALGLASEAATRFKKGLDPVTSLLALERAVSLAVELGAGKAVTGVIDVCAVDLAPVSVTVDAARVNALLGTEIAPQKMLSILESLYMDVKLRHGQLDITLPYFRRDIESDADIAEEIARVIGYDEIPMTLMSGNLVRGGLSTRQKLEDELKNALAALGALECLNYSFVGPAMLDKLHIASDERARAVKLQNPFGEDQSLMRTTLLPGLVQTAALNISRKMSAARFFEVGNVHFDAPELPEQKLLVGIVAYGKQESFFTLKGMLEALFEKFNTPTVEFVPGGIEAFHPTRKAIITVNGKQAGWIGQLHPEVGEALDIPAATRVFITQIDADALLCGADEPVKIKPMPKYPGSARDIALVVDAGARSGDIKKTITASGGKLLQRVELFDTYIGDKLPEGKKSLAYALEFRSDERTLTDEEVNAAMDKILSALSDKHDAVLRS